MLLPPAIISPSKKSQLKTPPHSTQRLSNFTSLSNINININNNNNNNSPYQTTKKGLLSPEFSSPNIDINLNINNSLIEPLKAPQFIDLPNKRQKISNNNNTPSSSFILPSPQDMPIISFPGTNKPPYSYATLIGMAILRSNDRRLTLAEIYDWISLNFKYYKRGEVGWQNSIRHNLSLNKNFEKTEKSKDKKGHFWKIKDGFEYIYCNIKKSKRSIVNNNKVIPPNNNSSETDDESNDSNDDNNDCNITNHSILIHDNQQINLLQTPKNTAEISINNNNNNNNNNNTNTNTNLLLSHRHYNYINKSLYSHSHSRNNSLGSIPELNIQYSSYNASPINIHDLTPQNNSIDFTSSFSCRANFELSPIKNIDNGPILEPMTPNNNINNIIFTTSTNTNTNKKQQLQIPSIKKISTTNNNTPNSNLLLIPSSPNNNKLQQTPIKTNQTNQLQLNKKIWASPSYLDDFYTSPINYSNKRKLNIKSKLLSINDSMMLINSNPSSSSSTKSLNNNNNNNKPNAINGYSTNEIFGIDVCTIHDDNESY